MWFNGEPSPCGNTPSNSFPLDQSDIVLDALPIWRDVPSDNADEPNMPPPSPRPVWRDSDELLKELTGDHFSMLPKSDSKACRRSRSPSPLGALLRRKRAQHKRTGKAADTAVSPGGGTEGKTAKARVSSRRRRTAGKAVWKDSPPAPRRALIDTAKLVDLMSDVEAAPRRKATATVNNLASRKGLANQAFGDPSTDTLEVGEGSHLPPPPHHEKTHGPNRHWRHVTHPLRARRKSEKGWRGRSSTRDSAPRPTSFVQGSPPGGRGKPTRSRHGGSEILSAAPPPPSSSAASFWKSTAPASDDSTPAHTTSRPRLLFAGGVFSGNSGIRTRSKKPPAPPRAPAFEPRRGSSSDHHRTQSDRGPRRPLPLSVDHTQFRHKSGGMWLRGRRQFNLPHDKSHSAYAPPTRR